MHCRLHYSGSHSKGKKKDIVMVYRSYHLPARRRFAVAIGAYIVLATASGASALQDSLTVSQAVNIILQKNHSLKSMALKLEASKTKTQDSRTAYYPSVNADMSYANIGPKDNLSFRFGSFNFAMAPVNNYDAHVDANILLFDSGKRKLNIKAAKLSEQIIDDKTAGMKNDIVFQVYSLVVNIAMMQQGIAIQNENIESLERHLNIVKKRVETGAGTDYEILKTRAQLASSQATLLDIKNNLAQLRIGLAELMSVRTDSLPSIKTAADYGQYKGNIDSLISVALKQRPEIINARDELAGLKIKEELIEKEMQPVLSAGISTGVKDGFPSDIEAPKFNWAASAQLHVPLYDGSREQYHLKEIRAEYAAANEDMAGLTEKIRAEVLSAYSDVNTAFAKLDCSAIQIRLGEESLNLAQKSLEAGTITNDDVLNTEKEYSQAKLVNLQDHIRYALSLYALNQATGISLEELFGHFR
jgi:outer membrane protein